MKMYMLERDQQPALQFKGNKLGQVSSEQSAKRKHNRRWTTLSVYQTDRNNFVLHVEGKSEVPGEATLNTIHILSTLEELPRYVGFSWLAKDLYSKLNLNFVESI